MLYDNLYIWIPIGSNNSYMWAMIFIFNLLRQLANINYIGFFTQELGPKACAYLLNYHLLINGTTRKYYIRKFII